MGLMTCREGGAFVGNDLLLALITGRELCRDRALIELMSPTLLASSSLQVPAGQAPFVLPSLYEPAGTVSLRCSSAPPPPSIASPSSMRRSTASGPRTAASRCPEMPSHCLCA